MSGGDTGPKIYFSDVFGLQPDLLEDYGAFNIALINDLPLFVDPFLLYDSQNDTHRAVKMNVAPQDGDLALDQGLAHYPRPVRQAATAGWHRAPA